MGKLEKVFYDDMPEKVGIRTLWSVGIEFNKKDIWVGVYWDYRPYGFTSLISGKRSDAGRLDVYVCLIPMFPVHIRRTKSFVSK